MPGASSLSTHGAQLQQTWLGWLSCCLRPHRLLIIVVCAAPCCRVEMLKTTLQSHEARAADFAGSAAGSAAAGVPAGTPSASAVLQQLEQLVADLSAIVGDDSDVCNRLLTVCQQLAVTHSRLHRLTALVNSPQVQANWQQQLAESAILDYEDDMEAHYLLIQKNNAKFSSAGTHSRAWLWLMPSHNCPAY